MRFYLISDNADTLVGMRLAGIEGELVHDAESVETVVNNCLADEDIGIILITHPLCEMCGEFIARTKRAYDKPLIVEIPDRHGSQGNDSITRYVRDTIGIKI
ncbi:MAG: V-type ATP synthase subunit F [Acutalibacteraceae bacterium]